MTISFARHQFPPAIIRHAVWLYVRFTLSALAGWVQAGKLKNKVDVQHGLENAPATLRRCSRAATRASSSCASRSKSYPQWAGGDDVLV
jgi:transposase-like protein